MPAPARPGPARGLVRRLGCGLGQGCPGQVGDAPGGDAEPRTSFVGAHRHRAPHSFGRGELQGWWHRPAQGRLRTRSRVAAAIWCCPQVFVCREKNQPPPNTDRQRDLSHKACVRFSLYFRVTRHLTVSATLWRCHVRSLVSWVISGTGVISDSSDGHPGGNWFGLRNLQCRFFFLACGKE